VVQDFIGSIVKLHDHQSLSEVTYAPTPYTCTVSFPLKF